jgi:hypothetical protein
MERKFSGVETRGARQQSLKSLHVEALLESFDRGDKGHILDSGKSLMWSGSAADLII